MSTVVNINGTLFQKEEAVLSVFDHGFLFGDSVYEVLITKNNRLFTAKEHFDRLCRSAHEIAMLVAWDFSSFCQEVMRTIQATDNEESYVRIILTRGEGDINIDPSSCTDPNRIIIVNRFSEYPKSMYHEGISIAIVSVRRNAKESLNPAIKTGNYLNSVLAIIEAKKQGAYDGLMLNKDNFISECTTSNFYLIKNGIIKTPSLESGILAGVTRRLILTIAKEHGIPYEEKLLSSDDIFAAEEAFVSSTTKGVMPVTSCNNNKIGTGAVGEITSRLITLYNKKVEALYQLF